VRQQLATAQEQLAAKAELQDDQDQQLKHLQVNNSDKSTAGVGWAALASAALGQWCTVCWLTSSSSSSMHW
jgi:hypothetical protein